MPRMKFKPATAPTAANPKQQATAQAQFKKIESRLATLDKEYAAVQAATSQLVAELLGGAASRGKASAAARASGRSSKATRTPKVQIAAKRGRPAAAKAPRQTVESVVITLLKANKKPMAFPEIMATIQKRKLIKTKSANFANVLRRTISTSSKIKRVGRGVYRV